MKILFVGEGSNDIGVPSDIPGFPRRAGGAVATLARRASDRVGRDSIALAWTEIHRFSHSARGTGYHRKVAAAVLLAKRKFGCAMTVVVIDRDGYGDRTSDLRNAAEKASEMSPYPLVWGLAVESIEAWTLGAPGKIAEDLGIDAEMVQQLYPSGVSVESMSERSGILNHRPKQLLGQITQLKNRADSTEFREAVANRTDVDDLAQRCPQGFAPFLKQLRAVLAVSS